MLSFMIIPGLVKTFLLLLVILSLLMLIQPEKNGFGVIKWVLSHGGIIRNFSESAAISRTRQIFKQNFCLKIGLETV